MDLEPRGCLFPNSDVPDLRVQECTPEKCKIHTLYSVVSARCPLDYNSTITLNPNSSPTSLSSIKFVRTRCMVNRTTEVFYWLPPVHDCFSTQFEETPPYFYGSIYTLRQLQQAFQAGKAAAVAVREKPLVSLSVGMSALSIVLVLIMLLGVCHGNAPDVVRARGSSASTSTQRQRQAAARRRARTRYRRRENDNRNSIGTQADVAEPSDRLFILPRQEFTRRAETSGVNAGFNDSEALLSQPQELEGHTPALLTVTHEDDLALPGHSDPLSTDSTNQGDQGGATIITTGYEDVLSRLSCLAVPRVDIPPVEYQPPLPRPPKILKGPPMLPSYEDATKRGMYCIIRPTDISAPPAYQLRLPDHADGDEDAECDLDGEDDSNPLSTNVFPPISFWDFDAYGVHRGSVNSMPEFSRLYGPPESPFPGDSPQ